MYYFTDKIMTERIINSELVLTKVTNQFVENRIIGERSARKDYETMFVCIHNQLLRDPIFQKLPYLQTMPLRDSLPMVCRGDIIFVIEAANDINQHYIMINVQ